MKNIFFSLSSNHPKPPQEGELLRLALGDEVGWGGSCWVTWGLIFNSNSWLAILIASILHTSVIQDPKLDLWLKGWRCFDAFNRKDRWTFRRGIRMPLGQPIRLLKRQAPCCPLSRVVGPLPNGRFMAYKWGWSYLLTIPGMILQVFERRGHL